MDQREDSDNVVSSQPYLFFSVIPKYPLTKHLEDWRKEKKKKQEEEEKRQYEEEEIRQHKEKENKGDAEGSYYKCLWEDQKNVKYIPADLTVLSLEKYWVLKEIIEQEYTYVYYNDEKVESFNKYENKLFYILGEFQFAFILFHLGFNYESFMQWRQLYELLCNSQKLIVDFPDFYKEVLKTICAQLNHLSDDFFDNTESSFILFGIYNIYDLVKNIKEAEEKYRENIDLIDSIIYTKLGLHLPDLSFIFDEFQPTYVCDN